MSQWTADEVGPETCADCGRPSPRLRCPACVIAHTRAYRRSVETTARRHRSARAA